MATNHELVALILEQTLACQDQNSAESKSRRHGQYRPLGPHIPGDHGSYPTTDAAMNALAELADRLRENTSDVALSINRDRMRMLTSEVFGLSLLELSREADRRNRWPLLRTRVLDAARASGKEIMHYVPVWLFIGQECRPVVIGPVELSQRKDWLGRIEQRRGKESPWMPGVRMLWAGGSIKGGSRWAGLKGVFLAIRRGHHRLRALYQAYRDAKRFSEHVDVFNARKIARVVHPDQWIACVEVIAFEAEESRRRGLLAVRLSLDTVRLSLARPNRSLISTVADSVQPFSVDRLSQLRAHDLAHGFKINRPGVSGGPGLAQAIVDDSEDLFEAAGACISAVVAPTQQQHRCPQLAERWVNAVHWYGRACLADVDFVAVVMLVIAMDVLCGGLEQRGIVELVARLTGIAMSQQVLNDGSTLKQVLERSYKLRSEVAHGSVLAVHVQLDDIRGHLEDLASITLDRYVVHLHTYSVGGGIDHRDDFLDSLPHAAP